MEPDLLLLGVWPWANWLTSARVFLLLSAGTKKLLREESQYRTKVWKEVVPWEARPASSALLWAALLRSLAAVSSQTSLMWWDGRGDRTRVCAHAPEVQQHIKSLLVYTFLPLNYLLSSNCGSPGLPPPHCFRNGAPGFGKLIVLGFVDAQWCNLKARRYGWGRWSWWQVSIFREEVSM